MVFASLEAAFGSFHAYELHHSGMVLWTHQFRTHEATLDFIFVSDDQPTLIQDVKYVFDTYTAHAIPYFTIGELQIGPESLNKAKREPSERF